MDRAVATLESALDEARQDSDNGYKTRFVLAMMLPQYHLSNGSVDKALELLATEVAFVSERLKTIKATGTTEQKQYANRVFVELRDYQTRLKLLGQPAPEIAVKEWISGEPATLATPCADRSCCSSSGRPGANRASRCSISSSDCIRTTASEDYT